MENLELNQELLEQAKGCSSPEALLELAKEHDIDLTPDQAQRAFELLQEDEHGPLTDEELEEIAAGRLYRHRKHHQFMC